MTDNNEKIRAIAEYLGWRHSKYGGWSRPEDYVEIEGEQFSEKWEHVLRFDTSYDWAMPVWKKMREDAKVQAWSCELRWLELTTSISCALFSGSIQDLTNAINFINSIKK